MVMPTELQYHVNSNMSHSYKKDFFFLFWEVEKKLMEQGNLTTAVHRKYVYLCSLEKCKQQYC